VRERGRGGEEGRRGGGEGEREVWGDEGMRGKGWRNGN